MVEAVDMLGVVDMVEAADNHIPGHHNQEQGTVEAGNIVVGDKDKLEMGRDIQEQVALLHLFDQFYLVHQNTTQTANKLHQLPCLYSLIDRIA